MKESKADRFRRVASARVNKIIKLVRLLGNCSKQTVYAFSTEQMQQIFATLRDELDRAQQRYAQSRKKTFSLSDEQSAKLPECPTIVQLLPDGSRLRAVAYGGEEYPSINIYWDSASAKTNEVVCFAEYNSERDSVCIAAYRSDEDEAVYYAPYEARKTEMNKIKIGDRTLDLLELKSRQELSDYFDRYGATHSALMNFCNVYREKYGNELCWSYPISEGKHLGTFLVLVKEGILSLPYDDASGEDYEIFCMDDAVMFEDYADMDVFLDDWKRFNDDLQTTMQSMRDYLYKKKREDETH